ncbi:MAG: dioxygenase [Myxococcales bacterium]|nr:dioxygenase [Myxococcales bacterium]
MQRRALIQSALAGGAALLAGCGRDATGREPGSTTMQTTAESRAGRMPVLFLAHGSPLLRDDARWVDELGRWARALPRPRAVLVLSAHWLDAPLSVGATRPVPLLHDFYGFPRRYSEVRYPAPGAPELAARVRVLAAAAGPVGEDPERGLDHGAYVPLVAMYPEADVPVLQVSLPSLEPAELVALGRRLAPLRDEGVLVVGSGFLTHNMRAVAWDGGAPPSWATDFDAWCAEVLAARDVDRLARYRELAPGVRQALPTHEHFAPVAVALGASLDHAERASFPIEGFTYGSFTKRSVQFG